MSAPPPPLQAVDSQGRTFTDRLKADLHRAIAGQYAVAIVATEDLKTLLAVLASLDPRP